MDYTSFAHWRLHGTFPGAISTNTKMLTLITALCTAICLPMALKNYVVANYATDAALLLFVAALCVDLICIMKDRHPPVRAEIVVFLASFSLLLTLYEVGPETVYWLFATAPTFAYVLPRQQARIAMLATTAATALIVFNQVSLPETLRIVTALLFIAAISDMSLAAVQSIHRKMSSNAGFDEHSGLQNQRLFETMTRDAFHLKQRSNVTSTLVVFRYHPEKAADLLTNIRLQRVLAYELAAHTRGQDFVFSSQDNEFIVLSRFCTLNECERMSERLIKLLTTFRVHVHAGIYSIDHALNPEQWISKAREQTTLA
jgi:GGDEF domain-containing protein